VKSKRLETAVDVLCCNLLLKFILAVDVFYAVVVISVLGLEQELNMHFYNCYTSSD